MSHQRYPSHDPIKEPHSISLKVLRLSRPSLVTQCPISPPLSPPSSSHSAPIPASLAYPPPAAAPDTNPTPFLLSPIVNLPLSFGSAYVGETFSCTLCANNDLPPSTALKQPQDEGTTTAAPHGQTPDRYRRQSRQPSAGSLQIRDVRIEAEMKTPASGAVQKLSLTPTTPEDIAGPSGGVDLSAGGTLQKVVSFDLKEEGNHVLAVTVSYYEATETSGRTRTFRKLYQFICKASLIVRTKVGSLDGKASAVVSAAGEDTALPKDGRKWVLEAQLENCSEDPMQLERVAMELEPGLGYRDCNWETSKSDKPVLQPGEVEQVCFVVEEKGQDGGAKATADGRIIFGVLGIGWRGEMGNRGFLSTGKLGARVPR